MFILKLSVAAYFCRGIKTSLYEGNNQFFISFKRHLLAPPPHDALLYSLAESIIQSEADESRYHVNHIAFKYRDKMEKLLNVFYDRISSSDLGN
jgi:hypothetical protein